MPKKKSEEKPNLHIITLEEFRKSAKPCTVFKDAMTKLAEEEMRIPGGPIIHSRRRNWVIVTRRGF
jgi:hypothetical protein